MSVNYEETPSSKKIHADFMMKMADRIIALVLGGMLSVPGIHWILKGEPSAEIFGAYLVLLGTGSVIGVFLMKSALKKYAEVSATGIPHDDRNIVVNAPPGDVDADGQINLSIEHGQTRISLRIEGNS